MFRATSRTYAVDPQYLLSDEIERAAGGLKDGGTKPVYLGRRIWAAGAGEGNRMYNHGGPSYVLNQASVGLLASKLDDDASQPHTRRFWEDLIVRNQLQRDVAR